MREASIAKTQVYKEVHADLRAKLNYQMSKPHLCSLAQPATSEFASAVEFGERSNHTPLLQRKIIVFFPWVIELFVADGGQTFADAPSGVLRADNIIQKSP